MRMPEQRFFSGFRGLAPTPGGEGELGANLWGEGSILGRRILFRDRRKIEEPSPAGGGATQSDPLRNCLGQDQLIPSPVGHQQKSQKQASGLAFRGGGAEETWVPIPLDAKNKHTYSPYTKYSNISKTLFYLFIISGFFLQRRTKHLPAPFSVSYQVVRSEESLK